MKRALLIISLILCVFVGVGCAQVTYSSSTPVPSAYFGMTIGNADTTTPWPSFPVNALRMWDVVAWQQIHTANGVFNWTKLDAYAAFKTSHGVQDIIFTFGRTPNWASSSPGSSCVYGNGDCYPPAQLSYWTDFVTALTQRYCGKIKYYEMWNEPNLTGFWSGTVADMLALAQAAYPIIHSTANCACSGATCSPGLAGGTNPNQVLTPSINSLAGTWWLNQYLAAGGAAYSDIIAYHGYDYTSNPDGFQTALTMFQYSVLGSSGFAGRVPAIWNTEASWGQQASLPTLSDQVSWIGRAYLTLWPKGVTRFFWYQYDNTANNGGNGPWGQMWTSGGGENTVATAYKELQKWMVGATETCTRYTDATWICTLSRNGYTGRAVWNANGSGVYTVPTGVAQYRDLAGNNTSTTAGTQISLTTSPLLFETANAW